MNRFSRTRAVLAAEWAAVRRRDADIDAGEFTAFTLPLLGWALVIGVIGVMPLVVVRMGDGADDLLLPLVASLALATVCSAVVTWLTATVISAFLTVLVYRKPARPASRLTVRTMQQSFARINDSTSTLMLLALVAGLVALAVGLPARKGADAAHSVVEDLLTSQVALLLVALAIAFVAEAFRAAADIIDDQSPALAWPWALVVVAVSWALATVVGPLEFTSMVRRLLEEWLPATVDGVPRDEAIAGLLPTGARWLAAFGALPLVAVVWWVGAWRHGGFATLRAVGAPDVLDEDTVDPSAPVA